MKAQPLTKCHYCERERQSRTWDLGYFMGRGNRQVWVCSRCMAWKSQESKERIMRMIESDDSVVRHVG